MVDVQFDFPFRGALFNNELGLFKVDSASGVVEGLKPGDSGYLASAFKRATIIFPSGSDAFTPDVKLQLNGGDILAFFLVQNGTLANLLANNPNNELNKTPLAFFPLMLSTLTVLITSWALKTQSTIIANLVSRT
jgi:hypothetical protein